MILSFRRSPGLFLAFLFFVDVYGFQIAFAQEAAPSDTLQVELEEVRIEAARLTETPERAPFSVTSRRFDEARIQAAPSLSLTEPLRGIPGVWVNDRNNNAVGERISVRGMGWRAAFGVRGVNILLDGVPLTMPDGQAIMSLVDPAFIQEVEVVRGPVSSFWGNAGGGAILMNTADFSSEAQGRVRFTTGSFGYYKTEAETQFISNENRFQVYASQFLQDGFRDHSRFEAYRLGGNADIRLDERSRLYLTTALLESPTSLNPGSITEEMASESPSAAFEQNVEQNARKNTRHGQFGARYRRFTGENSELNVQTYALSRRLQNPLNFAWIQVDRLAGGLRSTFQQERDGFEWGTGLDASVMSDDRRNWINEGGDQGELTLDQQENVYSGAAFGRVRVPFGDFSVSGGLRLDLLRFENHNRFDRSSQGLPDTSGERNFDAFSPMVGISYDFGNWLSYISYGTGFETPTTTELVNRPDGTGGFNPELQPERSLGLETGLRGGFPAYGLEVDLALFNNNVKDLLQQIQDRGGREYYRNIGQTRHRGLELLARWMPSPYTDLLLSYSYSNFEFDGGNFTG
ncbi:MAG: TonB-dependent receptor, partial [Cyclonatronaceae bacterium]